MDKFKITNFAVDDPQVIELMYSEVKEGQYGKFTTIKHNGEEKFWGMSDPVYDKLVELASLVNKGDLRGLKLSVQRKAKDDGKSYTDIQSFTNNDAPSNTVTHGDSPKAEPRYVKEESQYLFDSKKKEFSIISQVMLKEVCKNKDPEEKDIDRAIELATYFVGKIKNV